MLNHHFTNKREARRKCESLESHFEDCLQDVTQHPDLIYALLDTSRRVTGYKCILDPQAEDALTWDSFQSSKDIAMAVFKAVGATEFSAHGVVAEGIAIARGSASSTDVSADRWLDTLWMALACRDDQALDALCSIPTDWLRSSSQAALSEYFFFWVDAMKSYLRQGQDFLGLLNRAMEATDPDHLEGTAEHALKVAFPSMKLLYHLALDEQLEFQESLTMAVDLHQSFWSTDEEASASALGFVARGPLAYASLAYDAGMGEMSIPTYVAGLVTGRWLSAA